MHRRLFVQSRNRGSVRTMQVLTQCCLQAQRAKCATLPIFSIDITAISSGSASSRKTFCNSLTSGFLFELAARLNHVARSEDVNSSLSQNPLISSFPPRLRRKPRCLRTSILLRFRCASAMITSLAGDAYRPAGTLQKPVVFVSLTLHVLALTRRLGSRAPLISNFERNTLPTGIAT